MMDGSTSSLGRAASWIEAFVQGPIVTAIAVIAIAAVGLAMLRGQLSVRRGATVVLGCFVAFGAPSIARGLVDVARVQDAGDTSLVVATDEAPQPSFDSPAAPAAAPSRDPYSGASLRN